jgi:hypothetical protein
VVIRTPDYIIANIFASKPDYWMQNNVSRKNKISPLIKRVVVVVVGGGCQ